MGEERSSTWPTVTESAVTPGEEPDAPDEPPPVGVEEAELAVDPGVVFEEHATRITQHTESARAIPVRGVSDDTQRPRRVRIRTLSRFAFTRPPSVSLTSPCGPSPEPPPACHATP